MFQADPFLRDFQELGALLGVPVTRVMVHSDLFWGPGFMETSIRVLIRKVSGPIARPGLEAF